MKSGWSAACKVVAGIDRLTDKTGQLLSWLNLFLVSAVCVTVILRYWLNTGSIALQESAMYLHALIFLGASGYTLQQKEHVRVDIFYRRMSRRHQALVDSLGTLLLLIPVCVFIGLMSWEYVGQSWAIRETSADPGGLPLVYILKSMILMLVVTLLLQGVAEGLRSLMIFTGKSQTAGASDHG